jgi:cell division protein FtsQ
MDGRGRLAQSLTPAGSREPGGITIDVQQRRPLSRRGQNGLRGGRLGRWIGRHSAFDTAMRFLRGRGLAASALILVASAGYGVMEGGHIGTIIDGLKDARDMAANAAGFRIASIGFTGQQHISRDEILARAGVTGTSSLLFFDVAAARTHLMADPRIADATLLKLYPDRLQITIRERKAYALWQVDGHVSVVADDGSVLERYVSQPFLDLPLVVGKGAEKQAKSFLALMDDYPGLRASVRAYVLVAERRWNLRLKNGLDIKLPETDVASALDRLVTLDKEKQITTRDIVAIDLRQPDRVVVRMSDALAQAREAAAKEKAKAKKGGNA